MRSSESRFAETRVRSARRASGTFAARRFVLTAVSCGLECSLRIATGIVAVGLAAVGLSSVGLGGAGVVATVFAQPVSDGAGPASRSVDFRREIEPLLASRCVACHGPELQHGGLRLDDVSHALQGGHSRAPILGGSVEDNEIVRRVTASDVGRRMPKNAPPLSSAEIEAIKAWVSEGSPWITLREERLEDSKPRGDEQAQERRVLWERAFDWFEQYATPVVPYVPLILTALLAIGLVERCQEWNRKQRDKAVAEGREPPPPRFRHVEGITRSHYLNVALATALVIAVHRLSTRPAAPGAGQGGAAGSAGVARMPAGPTLPRNAELKRADSRYGSPPRPYRPRHPKRLEGVYYRGNCERSPALYNGGNYLTAKFQIRLCDSAGNAVRVGDEVPADGLFVQLDLDRGPATHPSFFTKETMQAVAISTQVFANTKSKVTDTLVRLTIVKPDWSWTARYSLGKPAEDAPNDLKALVYFYRGASPAETEKSGEFSGEFHYGIVAELKLKDGRLTDESDLWMGSLYVVGALEFPTPGKVPLDEWFDFRPIPEIVGTNTTDDPKLLGLPPKKEPAAEAPRNAPSRDDAASR